MVVTREFWFRKRSCKKCVLTLLFSMSDPGTTYRTREEIQQVRSEKDTIAGLKKNILDWGVAEESALKVTFTFAYDPLLSPERH